MAEQIEVTVILRQPAASKDVAAQLVAGTYDPSQANAGLTSADPADVEAVLEFANSHKLQVVKADAAARSIKLAGSADDLKKAFGIGSGSGEGSVQSLDYRGPLNLPAAISPIVMAVLGLDQRPIAKHHGTDV